MLDSKLSEASVEQFVIDLLKEVGYAYVHGPDIAPDSDQPERETFEDVLLLKRLEESLLRINPTLPKESIEDAVKQIQRLNSRELIVNNHNFHRFLTEGIQVVYQKDGNSRGDLVSLLDFDTLENNEFLIINQFTVVENNVNKRPDLVIFINGIPLVLVELKNPTDENATVNSALEQLQTYMQSIPSLFTFNGFLVISDGLEAKAGTISSSYNRFLAWKTSDGKMEASPFIGQLETLIRGMLNPKTLLDLLRHFIVFENTKKEDPKTGITTIQFIKKIAAYHQYYAVNKAVESTLRASGYSKNQSPEKDLLIHTSKSEGFKSISSVVGDKKGGVVWHTQGSGKSLSMVFYTGKIVLSMDNPTILVITDRNDLDDQLFDTFSAAKQLLRQEPVQAKNRDHLKELLKVASGGVVFATIQKFQPEEGNVYETLSERNNIIVIADEAHRTQYGFKAKTIDSKDERGNLIGKKIVYGFAKYMRDALPNATYLGFTGTPIENTDVNTPAVFGNYVDVYDIAQAVEDGATVRIYYESRLAKISLSAEGKKLIQEFDDDLEPDELSESQQAKAKWTQLEALIGSANRIQQVAKDIVTHFESRREAFDGKGMIVAMSRRIAAELYEAIVQLKPEWHSNDPKKGAIKVVMTSSSSDGPEINKHHTTKEIRKNLADRMKDPDDELKLVIVRDMWLTGFDVPSLNTLYIDKPMKGHNLMQAIARVNRVYLEKTGGLIVDYLGIASDLKQALSFYSDAGGKGDPAENQEKAVQLMLEKLEVVSQMFHGFGYEDYFDADMGRKLSLILEAENHILGLENGKKRFIDEVTALSKVFAIAIPHEQALDAKDEISFFQAVKSRLVKFIKTDSDEGNYDVETAIRQVIDKALVTDKVIDVFDAAGIKKPDISILSEEFLLEVKNMEHKNIALELLKKLLNDEIKGRAKKNLIQSKSLMEMLENSIKKYHVKILTAAEVIEELIALSKEIQQMDTEPKEMGLSDYEYAFYTAIADNDSAKELMEKEKLRELAVVLFQKVKENASIDWTIKENVKAKLKVIVKRILRQYGYPPDMQMLATETVLKQAELIANELISNN
ncbi:type I restriction endonuclease subunit R [Leptospira sp. 2 VSF19]|uniref:Type I restriction enzyme endonuclease subunit n=1 Tax=Leptospira soteropolitanensis TaxID=2950025 RepID=A0AAW5VU05_9LEPT|nr:type I restriction endonuclease subunit R [Leptospira soteropolitanensis]MCW7494624.1 type I restriction endonuclease subunit R [Leptospira soteropolitanensis]MCW7502208.1 type I restriction endonuclease subunit R [Leptospira soteropolitanensis]MCW7524470.1 type I restriction endonuclease subunit R [Leptospira soteropolitanensis]MCW7528336.1 type I restriction endonuclease subunit R [Leptospira soteropolitanensis]MCW7532189.1 type I restriction endonuclease subunit R [Leptospira soteropolit